MQAKKMAIISLSLSSFIFCSASYPAPMAEERTTFYTLEYENLRWYHKFAIALMGKKLPKEGLIILKERKNADPENKSSKIIELHLTRKEDNEELLYFKNDGDITEGFSNIQEDKFNLTKEEVLKSLIGFNYLYKEEEEKIEIDMINFFEKKKALKHCSVEKKKVGDTYLNNISPINGGSNKDADNSNEDADMEVTVNSLKEKFVEKILVKFRVGFQLIITKNEPESDEDNSKKP